MSLDSVLGTFHLFAQKTKEFKRTSSQHLKCTPVLNCTHKRVWLLKSQIKRRVWPSSALPTMAVCILTWSLVSGVGALGDPPPGP